MVGQRAWGAISALYNIIFVPSHDVDSNTTEHVVSSETSTTTTSTTTVTETTEMIDVDEEDESLMWTILSAPFILLEWIIFKLPNSKCLLNIQLNT